MDFLLVHVRLVFRRHFWLVLPASLDAFTAAPRLLRHGCNLRQTELLAYPIGLRRPRAQHRISMGSDKGKILVVSHDPNLADVRKRILEAAGYSVLEAATDQAIEEACCNDSISLIILGYSLGRR